MTPFVIFNAPHISNLNTKGLISDVHVIFGIFFSWLSFLPFKFVFSLSCFFFLFIFFFSSWWGLIREIKAILYNSSPISNLLSYNSCSLRYCCINSCFFLSYDIFLSCHPYFLEIGFGGEMKVLLAHEIGEGFPHLGG